MIQAIIGLGNPGKQFTYTRHNAGFLIIDALAECFHVSFKKHDIMESAEISVHDISIVLVKPQTFMNNSGQAVQKLHKKGITGKQILVIHDELELPFGKVKIKYGGGARGHNGLRSLISVIGQDFFRLSFGIGRPADRQEVPEYVLSSFQEPHDVVQHAFQQAVDQLMQFLEQQHEQEAHNE